MCACEGEWVPHHVAKRLAKRRRSLGESQRGKAFEEGGARGGECGQPWGRGEGVSLY